MNANLLLKSGTLWGALVASLALCLGVIFLSPDGISSLGKRRRELQECQQELLQKSQRNRELYDEVQRLAARDPELFEALARRQGYARPGETVFTFKEGGAGR